MGWAGLVLGFGLVGQPVPRLVRALGGRSGLGFYRAKPDSLAHQGCSRTHVRELAISSRYAAFLTGA